MSSSAVHQAKVTRTFLGSSVRVSSQSLSGVQLTQAQTQNETKDAAISKPSAVAHSTVVQYCGVELMLPAGVQAVEDEAGCLRLCLGPGHSGNIVLRPGNRAARGAKHAAH